MNLEIDDQVLRSFLGLPPDVADADLYRAVMEFMHGRTAVAGAQMMGSFLVLQLTAHLLVLQTPDQAVAPWSAA